MYPLKFKTIFKDKIWGGNKIKNILNKDFSPLPNCGETWEISGVEGNISVVKNGAFEGRDLKSLIREHKGSLVGEQVYKRFDDDFPLLVKFIDANDDLSIQVHPNDELAKKRHNSFGKTEMWYVFQADPGSSLISGFNQEMSKEKYENAFNNGQLMDVLNKEQVEAGDTFFLPAGRVHTIGKGLLLAEIQQTSDITYRIYDFDRTDDQGNTRELHVEEALDAIDYKKYDHYKSSYEDRLNDPVELANCQYFVTNKIKANSSISRDYNDLDSFVIIVCFDGSLEISADQGITQVQKGDAVLIPATIKNITLNTTEEFSILESWVPTV